ncbi:MAG: hydroxypyruvate isomerase [Anaerolineae bacterium]|nr:hydroxypyruvate isomerase [Anaerolineae bacterium]
MPTFAANLTMLYTDSPFLERFARARASGFRFVEYLFPYEYEPSVLARALAQNNLTQVLFNLAAGNWSAGDRGIAAHPDRISEFRQGVARALEYASVLGVRQVNCLVGKRDERVPLEDQTRVMIENLRYAARALDERGMTLLVEHLNPYDVPGFLIVTPQRAFEIQTQVGAPNLKIQYDVYHAQRTAGELANTLQNHLARIGHIQIADNPGRHQPGTGEINYRFLFEWIDKVGYRGYIGLEYTPLGTTEESLSWVREYGYEL